MPEIFHTLNRGVDKRQIFLNDQDRFRFVHDLFEFNDGNLANNTARNSRGGNSVTLVDFASRPVERKPRKLLVDILAFCLMGNHYHLLLSPRVEGSLVKFMRKLNIGYAKYFNEKYKRSGALFEGRYKSVHIQSHAHFLHMPYYIHLNPLDLCAPEWRERKIRNYNRAINFLESYRWSSFLDYVGETNFPSVTSRSFLQRFFSGPKQYRRETYNWLKEMEVDKLDSTLCLE